MPKMILGSCVSATGSRSRSLAWRSPFWSPF